MKKFASLIVLSQSLFAANSLLALNEGGLVLPTGNNAVFKGNADAGHALPDVCAFDPRNTAGLAMCDKVGFSSTLFMEDFKVDGAKALSSSQLALGSFSAFFPTRYFALGFGYDQLSPRYFKVSSDSLDWNLYGGRSSAYVGLAIPFGSTGFSLGFKGGVLAGSTREDLTWNSVGTLPKLKLKRHKVDDYKSTDLEAGLQFQTRSFGAYGNFTYIGEGQTNRNSTLVQTISDSTSTVNGGSGVGSYPELNLGQKSITSEAHFGVQGGFSLRANDLNLFALDGDFSPAQATPEALLDPNGLQSKLPSMVNDPAWGLSLGYTFGNSPKLYDSFFKKTALRTGLSLRSLGFQDAKEYKVSLGLGLPLGSRGSRVDLATELGQRQSSLYQYEQFVSMWISLHGFGNWGKPSRRYR